MFNNHKAHDRGCCGTSGRRYAGDRLCDAGARGRSLLLLVVVLALRAQAAAADPVGLVSEFSNGLNAAGIPSGIAPGSDGDLWFTNPGTTPEIGRITPSGQITEFTSGLNAGEHPGRDRAGTGRRPVVHRHGADQSDRADHPERTDHRVHQRSERRQPPVRDRARSRRQPVVHRPGDDDPCDRADQPERTDHRVHQRSERRQLRVLDRAGSGRQPVVHRRGNNASGRANRGERPTALQAAPNVTGDGHAGNAETCQGAQWSLWAGVGPSAGLYPFDAYRWLLDGVPIADQSGQSYTPTAAEVGHQLACQIVATYPLPLLVTPASATSAASTVQPSPSPSPSPPPPPAPGVPALSRLLVSPHTFTLTGRLAKAAARRSRAPTAAGAAAPGGSR